jgi:hypothetical protein
MAIAKIVAELVERGEEELADEILSLGANPIGKPQKLIMDYLGRPGGGSVDLTDMSRHPSFRGIHFAKIQKAAEVLDKKGMIKFDGVKLSKADADIDAELEEAAEAAGPHLFAVDCLDWPSSKKPDYKPWKEAVKEWAQSGPKNCEILDKEGEPLPEKVAFKAARKFGVMRAELDDAEIDAELEALADSDLSPEPSTASQKVLSKIHSTTLDWADEMDKMAAELKKAAAKEQMPGAKKRMEKLAKDMGKWAQTALRQAQYNARKIYDRGY